MKEEIQKEESPFSSYREQYVGFFARLIVDIAYGLKSSPSYRATKNFFYNLLENQAYPYKRYFDLMMIILIFSSVIILIREVKHPVHDYWTVFNDYIISVIFLVEYLLRFWVASDSAQIIIDQYEKDELLQRKFRLGRALFKVFHAKWLYVRSIPAIIDLLAIMPFFHELRLLRLFILFRVFKIFRYTQNMQYFGQVLSQKKLELFTLLTFASVVVFVASVLIYIMESNNPNSSINSLFDAFYWSIVTISTVGYGDVTPITDAGRTVAVLVIISGIAVIAFATSIVVTAFSEQLDDIRANQVLGEIKKFKHFYLICGYGMLAKQTASRLRRSGRNVLILDGDPERIREAKENRLHALMLDPASLSSYQIMGVDLTKQLTAVILLQDSDIMNVYTALTLRAIDHNVKILSILHEKNNRRKLSLAGIDDIVYAQELIGLHSKEYSGRPIAFETLSMLRAEGAGAGIEEIVVDERIAGNFSTAGELNIRRHRLLLIGLSSIETDVFTFNPKPKTSLQKGDVLIVMGEHSMIKEFNLYIHKRLR